LFLKNGDSNRGSGEVVSCEDNIHNYDTVYLFINYRKSIRMKMKRPRRTLMMFKQPHLLRMIKPPTKMKMSHTMKR